MGVSPAAEEEERSAVERLTLFSDAVVAIAITLLVLPLVDLAQDDRPLDELWSDNRGQFIAFAVSFGVIARFWVAHHAVLRSVGRCSGALIWINMLWLATIVFLPFPTELVGGPHSGDHSVHVVYVASILACSAVLLLLELVVGRLRQEQGLDHSDLRTSLITVVLMTVALVLVAAVPAWGLLPLALLLLSGPVEWAWSRAEG